MIHKVRVKFWYSCSLENSRSRSIRDARCKWRLERERALFENRAKCIESKLGARHWLSNGQRGESTILSTDNEMKNNVLDQVGLKASLLTYKPAPSLPFLSLSSSSSLSLLFVVPRPSPPSPRIPLSQFHVEDTRQRRQTTWVVPVLRKQSIQADTRWLNR